MSQAPTPSMVYDVIEACAQPGCPLCRVSDRWAARFVAALLYEEVTDPHTRGRLKESFGFCRDHAWRATEVGTTLLGMSIIYRGLVAQIANTLEDAAAAPDKKRWWKTLGGRATGNTEATFPGLSAQTECPACIHLRGMEAAALVAIADALPANERLCAGLRQAHGGLCLPHLRGALAVASPDAFAFLQESTLAKLAALQADLDEFIRKYDHRFNKEEWGDERDSWQRAVAWMVGGIADE
jgi:hypothetical protein